MMKERERETEERERYGLSKLYIKVRQKNIAGSKKQLLNKK